MYWCILSNIFNYLDTHLALDFWSDFAHTHQPCSRCWTNRWTRPTLKKQRINKTQTNSGICWNALKFIDSIFTCSSKICWIIMVYEASLLSIYLHYVFMVLLTRYIVVVEFLLFHVHFLPYSHFIKPARKSQALRSWLMDILKSIRRRW